jgi:hypothetical protein
VTERHAGKPVHGSRNVDFPARGEKVTSDVEIVITEP